jgi:ribonuclease-3
MTEDQRDTTETDSNRRSAVMSPIEERLARLSALIGYEFRNPALLRRALTHRSYANEQPDPRPAHNEALEFLGDAVLEFLISAWLFEIFPGETEGTLSKLRAHTVSSQSLQRQAARIDLGSYMLLNRGEEKTGGRAKSTIQVDAYEAVIAAIYLDGGIGAADEFVRRQFAERIAAIDPQQIVVVDYKTALQERLQAHGLPAPQYFIVDTLGPDHRRIFEAEARVGSRPLAIGAGTSVKSAHQSAARAALERLDDILGDIKS